MPLLLVMNVLYNMYIYYIVLYIILYSIYLLVQKISLILQYMQDIVTIIFCVPHYTILLISTFACLGEWTCEDSTQNYSHMHVITRS